MFGMSRTKLRRNGLMCLIVALWFILSTVLLSKGMLSEDPIETDHATSWIMRIKRAIYTRAKPVYYRMSKQGFENLEDEVNCNALAQHDTNELSKANNILHKHTWRGFTSEHFAHFLHNCTKFAYDFGYKQKEVETNTHYPLAYIILVDGDLEQLERLLFSIYTPYNVYCLHTDKKASSDFQRIVKYFSSCFANVFIASKSEEVHSFTFSSVQAQLNCMTDLLNYPIKWNYVIKLESHDFPLVTNMQLAQKLKNLEGRNYIISSPVVLGSTDRFLDILYIHKFLAYAGKLKFHMTQSHKQPPPNGTSLYYSDSPYYLLTRGFIFFILTDEKAKDFIRWFEDVKDPDRYLWASLNHMKKAPGRGLDFSGKQSKIIASKRIETMSDDSGMISKCHGQYESGYCTFGVGDLQWLFQQKHLFARRFSIKFDHLVVKCLLENLEDM